MKYTTGSPEETLDLGYRFGKKLKSGNVVGLLGELGAGKTVFTKGIAKALGIKEYAYVNSASFVIVKEYAPASGKPKKPPLYHFDLYRLKSSRDLETVDYEEHFYSDGITVIEWADRALDVLPENYIPVKFKHLGKNRREIVIEERTIE